MRDDIRRSRLETAHNAIAARNPHREIWWQRIRPIVVPLAGVALVAVLLVFAVRWTRDAVSLGSAPGHLVLMVAAVFGALLGVGLLVSWWRNRNGIPRSWRKYM